MQREFLFNIFFLVFVNLLIKPFYIFGIDLTVQNRVGPEVYGLYFSLLSLTFVFQAVNDFGIQNFVSSTVAREPDLMPRFFANLLIVKGLLALGYAVLTFLAAVFLGFSPTVFGLLGLLILNQILAAAILFLRSNVAALGRFRADSVLSSLDRFLTILLMAVLLWAPSFSADFEIKKFALAQSVSLVLTVAACFFLLRKNLAGLTAWHFDRQLFVELLKKSAPFAFLIFLMSAASRIDATILERLAGERQAGIYGNAFRMLDAANMVGFLFSTLLLPMFSRLLSEKKAVQPLLSLAFRILTTGAIGLCAVVFFNQKEISSLLNDRSDPFWASVLGLVIWVFVPTCVQYSFGALLTAGQNLLKMTRLFAFGLAANAVLNLFLIPKMGALGAAATAVLTQSAMAVGQIFLAKKAFDLKISRRAAVEFLAFFGLSLAACFFVSEKMGGPLFAKMGASFLACGAAAFLCKWLKINQLALFRSP